MSKRINFCSSQLRQYLQIRAQNKKFSESTNCASQIVRNFIAYYERLAKVDQIKNRERKGMGLMSAQTYLSKFKQTLRKEDPSISNSFLDLLHLSKDQNRRIIAFKNKKVHENAIGLPSVDGDSMIKNCRECLTTSNDPYKQLIALACLTGRRVSELLVTIKFSPPREQHKSTSSAYWTSATGFLKQRNNDPQRVIRREVPLLAHRTTINKTLKQVRIALGLGHYKGSEWKPVVSVTQANKKYAKQTSRKIRKYCDVICNIHQFRKFYALVCFKYFNENNCSLPRVASDYLGHKTVSSTILTYLNFRVINIGSLKFNI